MILSRVPSSLLLISILCYVGANAQSSSPTRPSSEAEQPHPQPQPQSQPQPQPQSQPQSQSQATHIEDLPQHEKSLDGSNGTPQPALGSAPFDHHTKHLTSENDKDNISKKITHKPFVYNNNNNNNNNKPAANNNYKRPVFNDNNNQRRSASFHQTSNNARQRILNSPQNQPRYRSRDQQRQESTPRPVVRSFQARSYVHDDLPYLIFQQERNRNRDNNNNDEIRTEMKFEQTATLTERPNPSFNAYFDKYDENLGLTKIQERRRIFYADNPSLMPIFQQMQNEEDSRKKINKLFKYYKTQRANEVLKTT